MTMKIAMISPFFVRCGIATYTIALSEALADMGCEVFGVRLPRFGTKTPELLQLVVDQIPRDKVDLVHIQEEYGLFQALEGGFYGGLKRLGLPVVSTMHAVGNWNIDRVVAEVSDRVVVHNEFCFRRFAFPENTVIIPHGCRRVECPPRDESKRSIGIPPEAPVVGYLGFISNYKGLEILVDAMTEIPEAALVIGGGWHAGPETDYIMKLKARSLEVLKGRCLWLGYVQEEKLPSAYGSMSLVVYPSRFATESGALLKALGHGKAVIASNISPFAEKEEVGALMTFSDLGDLRDKIRLLLKDEALRTSLEEGARAYTEANAWEKVAGMHLELYEKLLEHG